MTPFIDVMLVLLIIFMVAAPLLTVGVPLDLPQTKAAALNIDKQPLTISVKADGKIYLMETPITDRGDASPSSPRSPRRRPDERIYVRGDKAIDYGAGGEVMSSSRRPATARWRSSPSRT